MSKENVALIQGIYQAFGSGDIPGAFGRMSPQIVWNEAENFPYADKNPYIGPDAVGAGVFGRIGAEWDGFNPGPYEFLDAGDAVVVLCRYKGTFKATGKSIDAQVVHLWRVKDGKAASFQQYADTLQVARAMGNA